MEDSERFRIRPGQIRSKSAQRVRPFINQALAAAQKAGAHITKDGRIIKSRARGFGRGRQATVQANRLLTRRSRQAVIKARVVKHGGKAAPLANHLRYLRREGVTQDGDKAYLFGKEVDRVDAVEFTETCRDDRHHFRFIVSPEDALDMADLKSFSRDLMKQAEKDLGTRLDWVAVSHWNTDQPHVHIIVRGVTDAGEDLVISREYIKEGMRARAQELITDELGPRTDIDIHRHLKRQIDAERFTQIDRQLLSDSHSTGVVDLAPPGNTRPDHYQVLKAGRMRKLEALGLADQFAPGQWVLSERLEGTLRDLGERGDIIKRIHRGLTGASLDATVTAYNLGDPPSDKPLVGRLLDKGLDDELKGTAFAIIDATDGQAHHVRLANLEAIDADRGAVVELRTYAGHDGRNRHGLIVRSDLPIERQIHAPGATWLDRLAVTAGNQSDLANAGFGAEVRKAIESRIDHLANEGFARHSSDGTTFRQGLLAERRQSEIAATAARISATTGLSFVETKAGDYAAGTYRERVSLASGRFAVLADGMGFRLVPWSPVLESKLGEPVSGIARSTGAIDWNHGRQRGLGIG